MRGSERENLLSCVASSPSLLGLRLSSDAIDMGDLQKLKELNCSTSGSLTGERKDCDGESDVEAEEDEGDKGEDKEVDEGEREGGGGGEEDL